MRLVDSRRLRGANLQTPGPAALAEVSLEAGERPSRAAALWRRYAVAMARALGWGKDAKGAVARPFPGGIAFALPAPLDALLVATDVNDWAIREASRALGGEAPGDFERARRRFATDADRARNPALLALHGAARGRGVPFLWDDELVTVGMGASARTYPMDALPSPEAVPWGALRRVPVALVTGTNGKTTTSRLLARMAKEAGLVAGSTSTDGIAVDGHLVESGDWTGAEAARNVLRRPEVQIAVLETARGGILRRGLGVDVCDAAVVTNVTRDHLGEFGVTDLATMARTKCVVAKVVRKGGRVVLNADDPRLARIAPELARKVIFFSRKMGPAARAHVQKGGVVYGVDRGRMVRVAGRSTRVLANVADVPIAFGGAAAHNVENALAAAAAAEALRLPAGAVTRALETFGRDASDNAGRGHVLALAGGVTVLLDFGHNPAGMRTLLRLARSLTSGAGRLVVAVTQPGDRTDQDFDHLAAEIVRAAPKLVVVWESEAYLRGRAPGEIPRALARSLVAQGMPRRHVVARREEVAALLAAVGKARRGDVVVLAPLIDREAVSDALARLDAVDAVDTVNAAAGY